MWVTFQEVVEVDNGPVCDLIVNTRRRILIELFYVPNRLSKVSCPHNPLHKEKVYLFLRQFAWLEQQLARGFIPHVDAKLRLHLHHELEVDGEGSRLGNPIHVCCVHRVILRHHR